MADDAKYESMAQYELLLPKLSDKIIVRGSCREPITTPEYDTAGQTIIQLQCHTAASGISLFIPDITGDMLFCIRSVVAPVVDTCEYKRGCSRVCSYIQ